MENSSIVWSFFFPMVFYFLTIFLIRIF